MNRDIIQATNRIIATRKPSRVTRNAKNPQKPKSTEVKYWIRVRISEKIQTTAIVGITTLVTTSPTIKPENQGSYIFLGYE